MRRWLLVFLAGISVAQAGEAERVFERVRSSVVTITTFDERTQPDSEGSGVVIAAGQVVTNCHVVQEAVTIRVRSDNKEWPATLSLSDAQRDLCHLAVPGLTLAAVIIRGYSDIQIGEPVFAVGNPLGFGLSVSSGLVSALNQAREEPAIFTSAPVSPGSSGGGLFDAEGRLLGITTLAFVRGAQNMNVAVPADWIAELPKRGVPGHKAMAAPGPDPDWRGLAESLRTTEQWDKLAEWAQRWLEIFPTSAEAGTYLGLALVNLKQFEEAKQVFLKALQRDPRYATAHGYLAVAYQALGEKDAAMKALQSALVLQPAAGYYRRVLAFLQRENGSLDEALASIQMALRFSPGDEDCWELFGELLYQQEKYQEAVDAYRTVLRLKPGHVAATSNIAKALTALGEGAAARQMLATAPTAHTSDAATWVVLGGAEEIKGRFTEAERAFRKALEINPELAEAWYGLARSLLRTNRAIDAENAIRQALKYKSGFAPAWGSLGEMLNNRGDKAGAKEAFEKVVAADPSAAPGWFALGLVKRDLNDLSGAAVAMEKTLKLDPSKSEIWALLGEMQLRLGRPEEAFKSLKEAEKRDPNNEIALQALAMYYGMRGDPNQSLVYADRAISVNAASPNSWSNKGYSLLKLKRYAEAVQALETAIQLQPDFTNAWINLGEAHLRQKQLGKAIAALEKALQQRPTSADARLYVTQAYLATGQHAKVKEHVNILLTQAPDFAPAWYLLTISNVAQDNKPDALASYSRLKALNPAAARELRAKSRAQGLPRSFELPE